MAGKRTLATRSERQGAPVLIWPVPRPTTRSAIVVLRVRSGGSDDEAQAKEGEKKS